MLVLLVLLMCLNMFSLIVLMGARCSLGDEEEGEVFGFVCFFFFQLVLYYFDVFFFFFFFLGSD